MIRNDSRQTRRPAFTLIELLVVIAIIAILVSLTASAVMRTLIMIPQMQTRNDISQFDTALASFVTDFRLSAPPPSKLVLQENLNNYAADDPNLAFLKQVFGKNIGGYNGTAYTINIDWNGDGTAGNGPWTLEGEQCLIFYTGGIPNTAAQLGGSPPQCLGFSANSLSPIPTGSGRTFGPYLDFKTSRLVPYGPGGFFIYLDAWKVNASVNGVGPRPYVYFSSFGMNNNYSPLDCQSVTFVDGGQTLFALPYWTAQNGSGVPTAYTSSNRYQIISAGQDGKFGYNPSFTQPNNLWIPASGATGTGRDDQANFSSKTLGAGQQ